MYLLYSALLAVTLLLGSPYWIYEMLRHGKYRKGFRERLGIVPSRLRNSGRTSIWVHAVSVGEVLAVSELVLGLGAEFSKSRVVVSTTTDTGQTLAGKLFGAENVFYFPLDFAFAVRRWIWALRPELVVIAETEFWPNLLRVAQEDRVPVAIVNARISDRSLPGYRRWRGILRRVLGGVELFLAQTAEDAKRLVQIGAPEERVLVGGNLKYDVAAPAEAPVVEELRNSLSRSGAGPVLVCGSTVDGEEALLIEAFTRVLGSFRAAVMLLAPRHPQRFEDVAELLGRSSVPFRRRSQWNGEPLQSGVLLVDTIGELSSLYALADIAFVGGSLVPRGGHNIIEPAQHGAPIVVGPHTENFRDIVSLFQSRDAVRMVELADIATEFLRLLSSDAERKTLGQRAAETLRSQQGATEFALAQLRALLADSSREATPA
jgi:3-deoxy-D-manno-octulosonic-acid transferase